MGRKWLSDSLPLNMHMITRRECVCRLTFLFSLCLPILTADCGHGFVVIRRILFQYHSTTKRVFIHSEQITVNIKNAILFFPNYCWTSLLRLAFTKIERGSNRDRSAFVPQTMTSNTYIFKLIYLNVEIVTFWLVHSSLLIKQFEFVLLTLSFSNVPFKSQTEFAQCAPYYVMCTLLKIYRGTLQVRCIDQYTYNVVNKDPLTLYYFLNAISTKLSQQSTVSWFGWLIQ